MTPCYYLPVGTDPDDTDDISVVTDNNQCARQNRALLIELQRWNKEIRQ